MSHFDDRNEKLLEVCVLPFLRLFGPAYDVHDSLPSYLLVLVCTQTLSASHPALRSIEMETFHLLDLASSSAQPIIATAAAIAMANRAESRVVTHEELQELERKGGKAVLKALTTVPLETQDQAEQVW